jgi:hypothetical protein
MEHVDLDAFFRDGYAVIDVLSPAEASEYAAVADSWVERAEKKDEFQQVPDLPAVLEHPIVQGAVAQILGGTDLVLDTWTLMAVEVGTDYRQGWHRDIPLGEAWLPESTASRLLDAIANGIWWHNNVQCNLALNGDACYWAVPGSNRRAFSAEEQAVFGPIIADQSHLASRPSETDAGISGGVCVEIEPGQMILQNNVGIHRGWGTPADKPRRTLHFGFHSAHRPPTWHFRRRLNDRYDELTAAQRQALHPVMRAMLERRVARMAQMDPSAAGDGPWRQANQALFFTGGLEASR